MRFLLILTFLIFQTFEGSQQGKSSEGRQKAIISSHRAADRLVETHITPKA